MDLLTYPTRRTGCEEGRMYTTLPLLSWVGRLFSENETLDTRESNMDWVPKPPGQRDNHHIKNTSL